MYLFTVMKGENKMSLLGIGRGVMRIVKGIIQADSDAYTQEYTELKRTKKMTGNIDNKDLDLLDDTIPKTNRDSDKDKKYIYYG